MKKVPDATKRKFTWKIFLLSQAFLIAMSPILLYQFYRNSQRSAIRQHQAFTTATLTRFEKHSGRGHGWYKAVATYRVENKTFICAGKALATLTPAQRRLLIGWRIPVVYDKSNPSNSYLLSSERAFDRFSLHLPDSLQWTKLYFDD